MSEFNSFDVPGADEVLLATQDIIDAAAEQIEAEQAVQDAAQAVVRGVRDPESLILGEARDTVDSSLDRFPTMTEAVDVEDQVAAIMFHAEMRLTLEGLHQHIAERIKPATEQPNKYVAQRPRRTYDPNDPRYL